MAILSSGMALLGAQSPVQVLVKGIVIILAVLLDNMLKSRGRLTGPKFQLGSALKFSAMADKPVHEQGVVIPRS